MLNVQFTNFELANSLSVYGILYFCAVIVNKIASFMSLCLALSSISGNSPTCQIPKVRLVTRLCLRSCQAVKFSFHFCRPTEMAEGGFPLNMEIY